MGGGGATPTKGRKKALDAAINLVPFIDLLSCCLAFLLITAVWTQLARMKVSQKGPGGSTTEEPPSVQLVLYVDPAGYAFTRSTGGTVAIPLKEAGYDYARLAEVLRETHALFPDKTDLQIKGADSVRYNELVRTMDLALAANFPDLSVGDYAGQM